MQLQRTARLALAAALMAGVAVPATAEEPTVHPIPSPTFTFEDGLQGWTVQELPEATVEDGFGTGQGRGVHDTTWEQVVGGHAGEHAVALTSLGGQLERYGDAAHIALVSPPLEGNAQVLTVAAWVDHSLDINDVVFVEWESTGGTWHHLAAFGDLKPSTGDSYSFIFASDPAFAPDGVFRLRFRLLSDAVGSGVTPGVGDQPNVEYDTFRLDDVRVRTAAEAPEVGGVGKARRGGPKQPRAVVAINDTGINPYHEQFRDDSARAYQHPSTYLPGYPDECGVDQVPTPDEPCSTALWISLDAPTYEEAITRDAFLWNEVREEQLYWFPGTRIVGAYGTTGYAGCDPQCVLDGDGHGTSMGSRAVATEFGSCPSCLLVSVQGINADAVAWASEQGWIDAQSNSWGYKLLGLTGDVVGSSGVHEAATRAATKHLTFFSSGNGIGRTLATDANGFVPSTTFADPAGSAPGVINVGGHDSGYVNQWHDLPVQLVSDICRTMRAAHDSMGDKDFVGGGTSTASPYVAGHAVQLLLDARMMLGDLDRVGIRDGIAAQGDPGDINTGPLADGVLTLDEWRELVLKTATERPEAQPDTDGPQCSHLSEDPDSPYFGLSSSPVRWTDVPEEFPEYLSIGYGATDRVALEAARSVLRGEAALPDRSDTDAWMSLDEAARELIRASTVWP